MVIKPWLVSGGICLPTPSFLFHFPLEMITMAEVEMILNLIRYGESLKVIERSGWSLAGAQSKRIESVAEHSFGSVFSSILIAHHLKSIETEIDIEKVALMATLHDLPESITGDIARTKEFVENDELFKAKDLAERNAIKAILEPSGNAFSSLLQIWDEFILGESLESRVVRGADIIDMLIHARSLEESGTDSKSLHEFFESSRRTIELVNLKIVTGIYNKLFKEHTSKAVD
ncbi:MAG: HD domain-containing protein [Candidatus Thorarchaeota archaeon]|nr:MAG: HD domain-containing protein [Candidatus Thorarchaeota archaeon]